MPAQTSCPFCAVSLRLLDAQPGTPLTCPKCEREWTPTTADLRPVPPLDAAPVPTATPSKLLIACPKCAKRNFVPPESGGRSFLCKQCKARVVVPTPQEVHQPASGASGLPIECRNCGWNFSVSQDMAYAWTACPECAVIAVARPPDANDPSAVLVTPPPLPPPLPARVVEYAPDVLPPLPPPSPLPLRPAEPTDVDRTASEPNEKRPRRRRGLPARTRLLLMLGVVAVLGVTALLVVRATIQKVSDSKSPPPGNNR